MANTWGKRLWGATSAIWGGAAGVFGAQNEPEVELLIDEYEAEIMTDFYEAERT